MRLLAARHRAPNALVYITILQYQNPPYNMKKHPSEPLNLVLLAVGMLSLAFSPLLTLLILQLPPLLLVILKLGLLREPLWSSTQGWEAS